MSRFHRLSDALKASGTAEDRILSKQINKEGGRYFIRTKMDQFWPKYLKMDQENRSYCEVIRENRMVKPYWDIEFSKNENPYKDGYKALESLMDEIIGTFKKEYNKIIHKSDFQVLSSHSDDKFSIHLILTPVHTFFHNNIEVGNLTKNLIKNMDQDNAASLSVLKNGKEANIIDLGVYSKNRNFRLYLSTKLGQKRPMILDGKDLHHLEGAEGSDPKSLNTLDRYIFHESIIEQGLNITGKGLKATTGPDSNSLGKPALQNTEHTTTASINQNLDHYIFELLGTRISNIVNYPNQVSVINLKTKILCKNINGKHKSNNSYIVLNNLTRSINIKCHSQRCTGYKSDPIKIPNYI